MLFGPYCFFSNSDKLYIVLGGIWQIANIDQSLDFYAKYYIYAKKGMKF